jgi:hypothetical protein
MAMRNQIRLEIAWFDATFIAQNADGKHALSNARKALRMAAERIGDASAMIAQSDYEKVRFTTHAERCLKQR